MQTVLLDFMLLHYLINWVYLLFNKKKYWKQPESQHCVQIICFLIGETVFKFAEHILCIRVQLRALVCLPHLKDSKDELADPELDKIGSDIEEGGLDLSLAFQPITAYVADKREMLEQCFHVLGEKKLRKMLPDELKVICSKKAFVVGYLQNSTSYCDSGLIGPPASSTCVFL